MSKTPKPSSKSLQKRARPITLSHNSPKDELKRFELNYHPVFCYLGVAFAFFVTWVLLGHTGLSSNTHFYLPIVLLIGFYTLVSVLSDRQVYQKRTILQALIKAVPKYIFWGLALLGAHWIYSTYPLYSNPQYPNYAPNTDAFVQKFIDVYYWLGLPYFFLEEKYRGCVDNYLADPYIRFNILLKRLWRFDFSGFKRRFWTIRNRRTLLSWMIRIHYMPIMVEQVHNIVSSLNWGNLLASYSLVNISFLVGSFSWLIDSNNASIGYFWQSTFTKTRFRDADPHPFHWIIVLACYCPFILFVSGNFALFPDIQGSSPRIFASENINQFIDWGILVALVLYMLSTTTLAFSYSNLCYKSVQTRGPYGIVRHPATACKMAYFTLLFFRFAEAYEWRWIVCWLFWMGIYVGRAIVEERFLRQYEEYRIYMRKTRYRFFPGIA